MCPELRELRTPSTIRISVRRVGFMFIEADTQYLSYIRVRPEYRKKGFGAKMLTYAQSLFPDLHAWAATKEGAALLGKYGVPEEVSHA